MDPVLYVQRRGVGMYRDYAEDGSLILRAYPVQRLTIEIKSFIRDHKGELLKLLETPDLDYTVGNILALQPHEVEELRAEVAEKSPNDPWYHHDQEALRRAEPVLARRQQQAERTAAA